MASPAIFYITLMWLIVLLVVGTVAQKDIGLWAAQQRYFSSWWVWLGPLPLPGGRFALAVVFVNLMMKLAVASPWRRDRMGTLIAHAGALVLLAGGFITARTAIEGQMVIPEGGTSAYFEESRTAELAVIDRRDPAVDQVTAYSGSRLQPGASWSLGDSGGTLRVLEAFENCRVTARLKPAPEGVRGLLSRFRLQAEPARDDRAPRAGLIYQLEGFGPDNDGTYAILEGAEVPTMLPGTSEQVELALRPRRHALPFSLTLLDFQMENHPGIMMARSYRSIVLLREGDLEKRIVISMNEPLRRHDFTIYQAAFMEGPSQTTVLQVVRNAGRMYPYIASIIMCLGLLIHAGLRLPVLLTTAARATLTRRGAVVALVLGLVLAVGIGGRRVTAAAPPLGQLMIQDGGRFKPLDTVARNRLLLFQSKSRYEKRPAIEWLHQAWLDPQAADRQSVFKVRNPAVIEALGLEPAKDGLYSFEDLFQPMSERLKEIETLRRKDEGDLTPSDRQLVQLLDKVNTYVNLLQSVSCFVPRIPVDDADLARLLDVEPGSRLSYYTAREKVMRLVHLLENHDHDDPQPGVEPLIRMTSQLMKGSLAGLNSSLPVIPSDDGETWLSPWDLMGTTTRGSERQQELLGLLNEAFAAWGRDDPAAAEAALGKFNNQVGRGSELSSELILNRLDPFTNALFLYVGAFLLVVIGQLFGTRPLTAGALALLLAALLLHGIGIVLRMQVYGRPPVSNLYESVIFVSWIVVATMLAFEWRKRNGVGLVGAALGGAILLEVGNGYAVDGDTQLVAVLNSNFWLATHVVTITIGYGLSFVAGILGHVHLVNMIRHPDNLERRRDSLNQMLWMTLVALLFTTLGTILGGIWADQSWGRFWGWDPKENGALLIVLWQLMILHGRMAGMMGDIGFAAGLALGNICVVMAWFGVNLLGVGLHSYGFTEGIIFNIVAFCTLEFLLVVAGSSWALARSPRT